MQGCKFTGRLGLHHAGKQESLSVSIPSCKKDGNHEVCRSIIHARQKDRHQAVFQASPPSCWNDGMKDFTVKILLSTAKGRRLTTKLSGYKSISAKQLSSHDGCLDLLFTVKETMREAGAGCPRGSFSRAAYWLPLDEECRLRSACSYSSNARRRVASQSGSDCSVTACSRNARRAQPWNRSSRISSGFFVIWV